MSKANQKAQKKPKTDILELKPKDIKEHYQNEEIKSTILRCSIGEFNSSRCGNGDFEHWWKNAGNNEVSLYNLSNAEDYGKLTRIHRSLYWSLNYFAQQTFNKKIPSNLHDTYGNKLTIGTYEDTVAYSLGCDIDSLGEIEKPSIKEAVEKLAQFTCDNLRKYCPTSTYALFSGGGVYIMLHPSLFARDFSSSDREHVWKTTISCFNAMLKDIEKQFFKKYPKYKGKTKLDAINNQKRVFKTIFSVHRKKDYAVIPLNPLNIKIDFDKARIPLSKGIIESGKTWMLKYNINEQKPLIEALKKYEDAETKDIEKDGVELKKLEEKADFKFFPPCIQHMFSLKKKPGENKINGATRIKTAIACFLGQAGYDEKEAKKTFKEVSTNIGGSESNIFDSWFGKYSCPSCKTMMKLGGGFPHMNMGELEVCHPNELCRHITSPFWYLKKAMQYQVTEKGNITLQNIYDVAQKYFFLSDTKRIDIIMATALSNQLPGTPIWLIVVGASGDTKSSLAVPLGKHPAVIVLDNITPNTLASGKEDVEDLGAELNNKSKILIYPDLAALSSKRAEDKAEIWSQNRNLYDGFIYKRTGSGVNKKYDNCHVTMIGCSTPGIKDEFIIHAQLGTRELIYDTDANPDDNIKKMKAAWKNEEQEKQMQDEMSRILCNFLLTHKVQEIEISPEIEDFLQREANKLTVLRASGTPDRIYREMISPVYPEVPTRLIKQFKRIWMCLMSLRPDYPEEKAKEIISHLVISSGHKTRQLILDLLMNAKNSEDYAWKKIPQIQMDLKTSRVAVKEQCETLWNIGVFEKKIEVERIGDYEVTTQYSTEMRGGRIEEVTYYRFSDKTPFAQQIRGGYYVNAMRRYEENNSSIYNNNKNNVCVSPSVERSSPLTHSTNIMITGEHNESNKLDEIKSYVAYIINKGRDGVSLTALYDHCDKNAVNDCIASGLLVKLDDCNLYKWLPEKEAS